MIKFNTKHSGLFAAGVVFGTAGIKVLSSKDAKKLYTNCNSSRSSCQRLRYEDSIQGSGKRRGYLCRG